MVGDGKTLLMISKVGIAVKAGAPKLDVSTPEQLKAALLVAKTVGYSQGASGQHFLTVLQRLGITDPVKGKAVVVQGRPVGAAIATGEAEIGVQQVAELRPVSGVDQFAELPGELQKADSLFRRRFSQGERAGNRPCAGELPGLRAGAGRAQAQGNGPALIKERSGRFNVIGNTAQFLPVFLQRGRPIMARPGSAGRLRQSPFIGVERKTYAHFETFGF